MRAARVNAYGPPSAVVLEDVPGRPPGPGEAVVDIGAAAVNFPDLLIVANAYQVSAALPFTPGSEFAGTVTAVGEGVAGLRPGDQVIGADLVGAFAEQITVPAAALTPLTPGLTIQDGAAFRVTYRTAYAALAGIARAQPGEWVVVLGAAGGVGSAAIDVAHHLGCHVLAAASSDAKVEACRAWGADALVNTSTEDLKVRAKELTGGGADVVVDPVGGPLAEQALRAMRYGGRFLTSGFASGEIPRIPLNLVLLKGVIIRGIEIRTFAHNEPALAAEMDAGLEEMVAQGFRPRIDAVFPLEQIDRALDLVASRAVTGKVVIDMVAGRSGAGNS